MSYTPSFQTFTIYSHWQNSVIPWFTHLRHTEEKANVNETATPTEKFSGWGKPKPSADTGSTEENGEAAPPAVTQSRKDVGVSSELAFPSLADAAKIQVVAPPQTNLSVQSPGVGSTSRGPPRLNINTEKLRERIEKRNAADGILPFKPPSSDQPVERLSGGLSSLTKDSAVQNASPVPAPSIQTPTMGTTGRRPRFVLDKKKLQAKMEERNAAAPPS